MKCPSSVFALASTIGAFLAVAQNVNLEPGKYEATGEVTMSGSPIKMPGVKNVECITETDLRAFVERQTPEPEHCTVSDLQVSGNKAS